MSDKTKPDFFPQVTPAPAAEPQEIDLAGVRALLVQQIELNLKLRERMMQAEKNVQTVMHVVLAKDVHRLTDTVLQCLSVILSIGAVVYVVLRMP